MRTHSLNASKRRWTYGFRQGAVALLILCSIAAWAQNADIFPPPRLSLDLEAHLHDLAVSPDGEWIAAGGDRRLVVWNTRREVAVLTEQGAQDVWALAISPNGNLLAAGYDDGKIRLRTTEGEPLVEWSAADGIPLAAAFSPDGHLLATGGTDRRVRVWNPVSGELLRTLEGHRRSVFALAFDPSGRWLASGGADGAVLLWDVATGEEVSRWRIHQDVVSALAFDPSGRELLSAGWDGNILAMDLQNGGADLFTRTDARLFSLSLGPDGATLAVGLSDRNGGTPLRFWHRPSRSFILALGGPAHQRVAILDDGVSFVAATERGEIRLWQIEPRTPTPSLPDGTRTLDVRWNESASLYYEVQFTKSLPFRPDDTVAWTRATTLPIPESLPEDVPLYWRVRARSFAAVSEWTTPQQVFRETVVASPPLVWVESRPRQIPAGEEAVLLIHVRDASDLVGFEGAISIVPPNLEVIDLSEGEALGADDNPTFWKLPTIVRTADATRIRGIASTRLGGIGIDAEGVLVRIRVRARAEGIVTLRLEDFKLSDTNQVVTVPDTLDASLTVLPSALPTDVNQDGIVDVRDLVHVAQFFGQVPSGPASERADINGDGIIDLFDLLRVAQDFLKTSQAAPSEVGGSTPLILLREIVSHARGRGLGENVDWEAVEQAIAIALGKTPRTLLVEPTYPNPANPEVWIPFRLGERATVRATLFEATGRIVRRWDLGTLDAGSYRHRSAALHWDGRTNDGTPAASGLYLIRLEAIAPSGRVAVATRRVLLLR